MVSQLLLPLIPTHKRFLNQVVMYQLYQFTMRSMILQLLAGERQLLNLQITMERLLQALLSLTPTLADRDMLKPVG